MDDLKKIDADVRRHEQAHLSAAGGLARGGIVLNFKPGPDGKLYAVAGHVDIDTSPVSGNPTATLAKMATVQRAALAPSDPSGPDRAVAVQAAQTANKARAELTQQQGPAGALKETAAAGTGAAGGATTFTVAIRFARSGSSRVSTARSTQSANSTSSTNSMGSTMNAGQLVDVMG